jgi:hypothetical protein
MHSLIERLLKLDRIFSDRDITRLWEGILLYGLSSLGDTENSKAGLLVVFHYLL